MQTKLTVRVNDQLIQSAKRYAHKRGISLSRLIENYLSSLAVEQDEHWFKHLSCNAYPGSCLRKHP